MIATIATIRLRWPACKSRLLLHLKNRVQRIYFPILGKTIYLKMSCLPKPVLRGHIQRRGLKMLFGAITFASINAGLFHFFVALPKKRKYEEFIRTYDAEQHFKELVAAGLLQSEKKK